jgi:hypothetical protein
MLSWRARLEQARAAGAARDADPIRGLIEDTVRGMEHISTNSLLTLIGLPVSTANARRVAPIMAALGFVPIKSRRLVPGGFRGTVTRGWGRPFHKPKIATAVINGRLLQRGISKGGGDERVPGN